MVHADAIIVGGGPAGSACARRLRQRGIDCMLLERRAFPRDKPCAGWIPPRVLRDLEIDASDYPHGFTTFRTLTLRIGRFRIPVPGRQHAIRRVEFDQWLLARARVPVHRHGVASIVRDGDGFVVDGSFSGRFIVGAGGTSCPVYRTFFRTRHPRPLGALVVTRQEEFACSPATDECLLWVWKGLPGYAWYVPKAGGYANIGLGAAATKLKAGASDLRAHWEHFVERLEREALVPPGRHQPATHAYYLQHRPGPVRSGNAFIAGDAAGLATLDMGEGIGPAIRSGILAADAIATGGDYSLESIPRYSRGTIVGAMLVSLLGSGE
jgi:menaquinone-9 beta-reductase